MLGFKSVVIKETVCKVCNVAEEPLMKLKPMQENLARDSGVSAKKILQAAPI